MASKRALRRRRQKQVLRHGIRKLKEKKGSTMVEAAMVFPVVILALTVMIYGMLYLFDETAAASAVRRAVIREAGRKAGTVTLYNEGSSGVPVTTAVYGIRPCSAGEKTAVMKSRMPGVAGRRRTLSAHQYICNEKTEIRLWDLFQ
ncbi:MAG: pilus assembly protein [Clostridiales bacterium]|nr:pilus assembly protein [Clostridiales bacterium]